MRRSISIVALLLTATAAAAQTPPDLPTDPVKAIDGEWYGVDKKIKLSVANGVVTIVENDTTDLYIKKITAPVGTVIARLTGSESNGPKSARLIGQCLELLDTSRSGTIDCPPYRFVESVAYDGKLGLMLHFWNADFLRKTNIPSYQWQYRK